MKRRKSQKSCSIGTISRKGYTRKTKTGKSVHVKRKCVRNIGLPGKYSTLVKKQRRSISAKQSRAAKRTTSPKSCSIGEIKRSATSRKGYIRRSKTGKLVKVRRSVSRATCVKNRGAKGKSSPQQKITIVQGEHYLSKFGYSAKKSTTSRHTAIKKLIKSGKSPLAVRHMLIARSNLLKRTEPTYSKKMYSDQKWTKKHYKL